MELFPCENRALGAPARTVLPPESVVLRVPSLSTPNVLDAAEELTWPTLENPAEASIGLFNNDLEGK